MDDKQALEIFKEVLEGKRGRVPNGFWRSAERRSQIIRFIVKDFLKFNTFEEIRDFDIKTLKKYKMGSVTRPEYTPSLTEDYLNAFPEFKAKLIEERQVRRDFWTVSSIGCKRNASKQVKLLQLKEGLICPICNLRFLQLTAHVKTTHGLSKEDLQNHGYSKTLSPTFLKKLSNSSRKHINRASHTHADISIPQEFWSAGCEYAKVALDYEACLITLTPCTSKVPNTLHVRKSYCRYRVYLPRQLTEDLIGASPRLYLDKAGVVMQFEDNVLFPAIEARLLGKTSEWLDLVSRPQSTCPHLVVSMGIWPISAEYAYLSYERKGIVIYPVTRAGEISTVKFGELQQGKYIGVEKCVKVYKRGKSMQIMARRFFSENSIPHAEWRYMGTKPDGKMRFSLFRRLDGKPRKAS